MNKICANDFAIESKIAPKAKSRITMKVPGFFETAERQYNGSQCATLEELI